MKRSELSVEEGYNLVFLQWIGTVYPKIRVIRCSVYLIVDLIPRIQKLETK